MSASRAEELDDDDVRVRRFREGRRTFVPRDDDVWVVSYPRSGTTWTLFLVHLLHSRGALDFEHIDDVAPWFERALALGHTTPAELEALPSPRVFKSHLPFACAPSRGRLLYVERHGADVALSYFHLYRGYLDYRGSFDAFFTRFLDGDVQYRSWLAHTRAWRRAARDHERVLSLRYEELQADLAREVRRMSAFLGTSLNDAELARVTRSGSFAFMKQNEARFDFARVAAREERKLEERRFLRQGRVGEGIAHLSSSQRAAFAAWLERAPEPFDEERHLADFLR